MDHDEARTLVQRLTTELGSGGLLNRPLAQLQEYYDAIREARKALVQFGYTLQRADNLLQILRQEIEAKRAEQRANDHHSESVGLDRKILRWTRWAVAAAVVVPIVVALIAEIAPSMLHPAKSSEPLPVSSPKESTTAAPTQQPTPSASPTESGTASPTPATESTPAP